MNEIKLKKLKKTVRREKLVYRANEYTYNFKNFQTINTFGKEIYNGEIIIVEVPAQVEASYNSKSLLNETRQIVYSL